MTNEYKYSILLVEDEALIAMAEKMELERRGYIIHHVTTGEKAIETIIEAASSIDLILMDIDLGKGIDGTQAAQEILEVKDIPVVFLSSHAEPEIVEKTEKITSYGYAVKNSGIMVLDASIKMALKLFEAKKGEQEKALIAEENEQKYRDFFEQSIDGIFLHDMKGTMLDVNTVACEQHGYSKEDLLNLTIFDLHTPPLIEDNAIVMPVDDILSAWESLPIGKRIEINTYHKKKDGSILPVKLTTGKIKYGKDTIMMAITQDITKQKEVKEDLEQTKIEFDHYFNESPDLLCIANTDGYFVRVNNEWEKTLGYSIEELEGIYFFDLVHPDDREKTQNAVARLGSKKEIYNFVNRYKCKDGSYKYLEWRSTPSGKTIYAVARDITEKLEKEKDLFESKELFKNIFELSTVGIAQVAPDGTILKANKRYCDIVGYAEKDLYSRNVQKITHPDDIPFENEYVAKVIAGEISSFKIEKRYIQKNGNIVWVELFSNVHRDDSGKLLYAIAVVTDISEMKNQQKKLIESENKYRTTIESISDAFMLLEGPELNIVHFNKSAEITLNRKSGDVLGKPFVTAFPEAKGSFFEKKYQEAFEQKISINFEEFFGIAPYKNWYSVRVYPSENSISVYFQIITERKHIEEVLRESERRLLLATRSAGVGIWDWDIINNDFFWDDRIFQMYGITDIPDNFGLEYWKNCLHPDDMEYAVEACQAAVRGEKDYDVEFRVLWPDGKVRWMKADGVVVLDDEGKPIRMIGTNYDITERKQAEEEIQKQLKEKETLLREVHHRVKNNITNIESFLKLQIDSTNNSEAKEAIKDAVSRIQSMRVLYDRILLSKDLHEISIKNYTENLIDSLQDVFSDKDNIIIKQNINDFNIASKQAITIGIIINELLTNVFKYAFKDRDKGVISISVEKAGSMVTAIIKDNGIGIDKRILENKSPGFGLTIVKMLVEQIGGTYTVENDNGTSSILKFEI